MSLRKFGKLPGIKFGLLALAAGLFVICGGASRAAAQTGNMYDDGPAVAAIFAAEEGGKRENATIGFTMMMSDPKQSTNKSGTTYNLCFEVSVKRGDTETTEYAKATVFRDKKRVLKLKKWKLYKNKSACP
ncbi:MAG: hypothetical protein JSS81_12075 [Acidobacteria bacterium]|nr:hypothetical protein [Acidobacteriota bacterium]